MIREIGIKVSYHVSGRPKPSYPSNLPACMQKAWHMGMHHGGWWDQNHLIPWPTNLASVVEGVGLTLTVVTILAFPCWFCYFSPNQCHSSKFQTKLERRRERERIKRKTSKRNPLQRERCSDRSERGRKKKKKKKLCFRGNLSWGKKGIKKKP